MGMMIGIEEKKGWCCSARDEKEKNTPTLLTIETYDSLITWSCAVYTKTKNN